MAKPLDPCVLRTKVAVFVELARKSRQLQEQAAELRRSNEELESFAHVASHDLRSPLAVIAGYLEILKQQARGKVDEVVDECVDRIGATVRRMDALITDLLAYASIERSAPRVEPADCNE